MENLAEDAEDVFQSCPTMTYNENNVLHPLLPERNENGYELRRRRYERVLTIPNAISFAGSYINIGLVILTFPPANFLCANCDLSIYIYPVNEYVMLCNFY